MSLHLDYVKKQSSPIISLIFDNITCWNETANHTLLHDWQESDHQRHCPPGTELKNFTVTQSNEGNIEYYCGKCLQLYKFACVKVESEEIRMPILIK